MKGVHVAIQGVGSVGGGLARLLATDGARLTLDDVNADKAKELAEELGAETVDAAEVLALEADIVSPHALGAILTERTISRLLTHVIAGGCNKQRTAHDHGKPK